MGGQCLWLLLAPGRTRHLTSTSTGSGVPMVPSLLPRVGGSVCPASGSLPASPVPWIGVSPAGMSVPEPLERPVSLLGSLLLGGSTKRQGCDRSGNKGFRVFFEEHSWDQVAFAAKAWKQCGQQPRRAGPQAIARLQAAVATPAPSLAQQTRRLPQWWQQR